MAFVIGRALDVLNYFVETPKENGNRIHLLRIKLVNLTLPYLDLYLKFRTCLRVSGETSARKWDIDCDLPVDCTEMGSRIHETP